MTISPVPWSKNMKETSAPKLLERGRFDQNKRAFPFFDTDRKDNEEIPFIEVTRSSVTFYLQTGPIKEYGVNGCQIDDMIKFVLDTISVFNEKFPCQENENALKNLQKAWKWLAMRKMDREARQVEGTNQD